MFGCLGKIRYYQFLWLALAISVFGIAGSLSLRGEATEDIMIALEKAENSRAVLVYPLNPNYYIPDIFWPAVQRAPAEADGRVMALIAPHHLLPIEKTAEYYRAASGRTIKTVIIIGPNHANIGNETIATVAAEWDTGLGRIRTNDELVRDLAWSFGLAENNEVFENEHAIGAHLPLIKYFFPAADIVPIALSANAGHREAAALAQWLETVWQDDFLLVFSIDFSHYLSREEADKNDKLTRQLIAENNIGEILQKNNDYFDSPAALAVALKFTQVRSAAIIIGESANSADFLDFEPAGTTSYFWAMILGSSPN